MVPWQPPSALLQITKYLLVSIANGVGVPRDGMANENRVALLIVERAPRLKGNRDGRQIAATLTVEIANLHVKPILL